MKKIISLFLVFVAVCSFAACNRSGEEQSVASDTDSASTELNYDGIDVNAYVNAVTYKGLFVTVSDGAEKQDALWRSILDGADIDACPDDKAQYYFNQTKRYYMYLANNDEDKYAEVLTRFGTDETEMLEEAKELVAKDLIYRYIVEAERIEVSEEEKAQLFERYVDKYVNDYGYNREYVEENMAELIYDSMLYDKTMEFLMANNSFDIEDGTQN